MKDKITGMMIYYMCVCPRKLWYFCHEIQMEYENEDVMLGKLLDDHSYARDNKHINIDDVINIDFMKEHHELHEIKKSKAIEEAGIWQVKYYLYYLMKRGVTDLTATIDYPLLKEKRHVKLLEEDITYLEHLIEEIQRIDAMENPPKLEGKKICKKCAYHDLCFV